MKKINRSREDRIISGVCGGFAEYFNIDSTIVRLIWIFITIFGGIGILAYIFSIILIPESDKKEIKLDKKDDDKDEKLVLWGVVIIVVGILLFFRHGHLVGALWHTFTANWLNIIFAMILIGIGIYIMVNRNNDRDKLTNKINTSNLHLSEHDKKLAGVCGGLAESFEIDSTIIRLLWILGTLISAGIGIVLYIICMLVFKK
jgi:phage shock protein PspC (stress-responsive transcriptional regulator)